MKTNKIPSVVAGGYSVSQLLPLKAYAMVFEAIIRNGKGLCAELPGFAVCERLRKHF